mmetsp:Transcript_14577/g.24155  ORF Transcript_14577/g.24155 Transcript_14577/m.24155 type:complete len:623 (+) Transcript_14577:75-1943(+)
MADASEDEQAPTQTQTSDLMKDIFDDSDDDADLPNAKPSGSKAEDSDDDLFADSDDEGTGSKPKKSALTGDLLQDSDDEDVLPRNRIVQRTKKGKGQSSLRTKKIGKKRKSRTASSSVRFSDNGDKEDDGDANSGDEYDSGEDVQATKEDRDFIDDDDEHADLVREYDEDNTDFNDERGEDDYRSKKKKKRSSDSGGGSGGGTRVNLKDQDPLSQTLAGMKNPKAKQLSDQEKDIMVEKLQVMMNKAVKMDNTAFDKNQPAVHKMQMLAAVKTTLSMKPLQQTLLDKDILFNLREWIEPKDAQTLPSLSVRKTVYELLLLLPCMPEHLKRSDGPDKPRIGETIVALRKHKMETPANKRLLKEIMDKWSRPIFSKSTDVRMVGSASTVSSLPGGAAAGMAGAGAGAASTTGSGGGVLLPNAAHPELQQAVVQKYRQQQLLSGSAAGGGGRKEGGVGAGRSSSAGAGGGGTGSGTGRTNGGGGFGALLKGGNRVGGDYEEEGEAAGGRDADAADDDDDSFLGGAGGGDVAAGAGAKKSATGAAAATSSDMYQRARTPYNTGFLFTVRPELKNIDKRNVMEQKLGEGRMKLFKKATEGSAGNSKGLGRKSNPRAMDMSISTGVKS